jgi:DNA-binding PadR family transcriptional regulator
VAEVTTSYVLLGLLASGTRHGYELKREHDAQLPQAKPLAFGQVYATLNRLLRDGLIVEAATDRAGGPDRTAYAVTEEGRSALAEWLAAVEPPAPYVNSALFAKVVIAALVADEATTHRHLTAQRAAHAARMRELTTVKTTPGARLSEVLAADYAIAHLDADLHWMQTTVRRVAELRREVHR